MKTKLLPLLCLIPFLGLAGQEGEKAQEGVITTIIPMKADHNHTDLVPKWEYKRESKKTIACRYASDIPNDVKDKQVALTFDDGPAPGLTSKVLKVLEKHKIKATFFMVGGMAKEHPDLVTQIQAAGHEIGNHSYSHPNFMTLSDESQLLEILKTQQFVPHGMPLFFRYPYGNGTCFGNQSLRAIGYKSIGWHIDSCDWAFDKTGKVSESEAKICEVLDKNKGNFIGHVLDEIEESKGGIVLFHV